MDVCFSFPTSPEFVVTTFSFCQSSNECFIGLNLHFPDGIESMFLLIWHLFHGMCIHCFGYF
jgi:hypothetical protein